MENQTAETKCTKGFDWKIILICAFLGAFAGGFLGKRFTVFGGYIAYAVLLASISFGIVIGIFITECLSSARSKKIKALPAMLGSCAESSDFDKGLLQTYEKEIKMELECRKNAATRLNTMEFWIQNLSIYYSCFTAALTVLGLVVGKPDFISKPSAIFTVIVAILVTYANAQKCGVRAADLISNCNDLFGDHMEMLACVKEKKESEDAAKEQAKEIIERFKNHLTDSECYKPVDLWKYKCQYQKSYWILYGGYCLAVFAFVAFVFSIPAIYVGTNATNFLNVLGLIIE